MTLSTFESARMAGQTCFSACSLVMNACLRRRNNVAWAVSQTCVSIVPRLRTTNGNRYLLTMLFKAGKRTEHSKACVAKLGICSSKSLRTMTSVTRNKCLYLSKPTPKFVLMKSELRCDTMQVATYCLRKYFFSCNSTCAARATQRKTYITGIFVEHAVTSILICA